MTKTIISLYGRSETGASRPFLCEDESGQSFFVKRDNVSWDQLILEYTVGSLGTLFGIPVAPFDIVRIPPLLAAQVLEKDGDDFHPGLGFGSQRVPFGEDLGETHLGQIPDATKIAILCFDWWTRNSDRKMSFATGCPNLQWDPLMGSVVAIDHDGSLQGEFDGDEFFREHAFRDIRPFVTRRQVEKLRVKFESAIYSLDRIWEELPDEWLSDPSTGAPRATLTMHDIESALLAPELPSDGVLTG